MATPCWATSRCALQRRISRSSARITTSARSQRTVNASSTGPRWPLTISVLPSIRVWSPASSGLTGQARPPPCGWCWGSTAPPAAMSLSAGNATGTCPPLRDVGALIDAKAIHPSRSAYHHLLGLAQSNGIPARRVDEVLGLVGLEAVAGRRVGGFSLGMSQLLGIAAALLGDPPVLMFDEPVNGLDPEGIVWIRPLMRDLAADGRTVVVSSQPALPNMMPSLPGMGSMFPSWPGVRSRCYANHYEHRTSLPTDRGH